MFAQANAAMIVFARARSDRVVDALGIILLIIGCTVPLGCTGRHAAVQTLHTTPTRPRPAPAKPSADTVKRLDERAARLWERLGKDETSAARSSNRQANPSQLVGHRDTTTLEAARTTPHAVPADDYANRESGSGSAQPGAGPEWPPPASAMTSFSLAAILAAAALAVIAGFVLLRRRGRAA